MSGIRNLAVTQWVSSFHFLQDSILHFPFKVTLHLMQPKALFSELIFFFMPRKGEEKIFIVCNVWKYQVWQWQDHWHGLTRAKQNLILSQIPKEKKQKLAIKKPLLRPSNAAEELYNFFFAICHDVSKSKLKWASLKMYYFKIVGHL